MLAPIHLANDAGSPLGIPVDDDAARLPLRGQSTGAEASTAAQSGEMKGEASPPLHGLTC